jgi:hypothetical protein
MPFPNISKSALLYHQTNVKSPVANLVAVFVVIIVVAFFASLFTTVPSSVLAGLVFVALAPVVLKCFTVFKLYKSIKSAKKPTNVLETNADVDLNYEENPQPDIAVLSLPSEDTINPELIPNQEKMGWKGLLNNHIEKWQDLYTWCITFIAVLIVDVTSGIYAGLLMIIVFKFLVYCIR